MKVSNVVYLTFFLFAFSSCQKEEIVEKELAGIMENSISDDEENSERAVGAADELCSCDGFVLAQTPSGEYGCPSGDGCAKIQPCPCDDIAINHPSDLGQNGVAIARAFQKKKFEKLKTAMSNGSLPSFFNSQDWRGVFNGLQRKPALLSDLKAGTATVVEHMQGNNVYYFIVDSSVQNNVTIQASDVLMAIEVPSNL